MNDPKMNYNARKTVCEMLHDRHYELVPYGHLKTLKEVHDQQYDVFQQQFQNTQSWQLLCTKEDKKIATLCIPDYKAAADQMIMDNIKALEVTSLIVITAVMPKRN